MKIVISGENTVQGSSVYLDDTLIGGVKEAVLTLNATDGPFGTLDLTVFDHHMLGQEQRDKITAHIENAQHGKATYNIADLAVKLNIRLIDPTASDES